MKVLEITSMKLEDIQSGLIHCAPIYRIGDRIRRDQRRRSIQDLRSSPVCMLTQANHTLVANDSIRNGWLVQQANLVVMAGMRRANSVSLDHGKTQRLNGSLENELGRLIEPPVESSGKTFEAWQNIFREPNVVPHLILLAANLIALLVIGCGRVLPLEILIVSFECCFDSTALFAGSRIATAGCVAVGMRGFHLVVVR